MSGKPTVSTFKPVLKGFIIIIKVCFKLFSALFVYGVATKFTLVRVVTFMKIKTSFNPRLNIT